MLFIAVIALFLGAINADARCTYQQRAMLNEEGRNVRTSYEITYRSEIRTVRDPDGPGYEEGEFLHTVFNISVFNITENLYVEISNNHDRAFREYVYFRHTENGVFTFTTEDIANIITYTFRVRSAIEDCSSLVLRTYSFVKPMRNTMVDYGICAGAEDVPYCQEYITQPFSLTFEQVDNAIQNYQKDTSINNRPDEEESGLLVFIQDNTLTILVGAVVLAAAAGGAIYFYKKRSAL
jgi:hypothetical protein